MWQQQNRDGHRHQKIRQCHHDFLREAIRYPAHKKPAGNAGTEDPDAGSGPDIVQLLHICEALIFEDELHMRVDCADGTDGAEAADGQQPERRLPEQVAEGFRLNLLVGRCFSCTIGELSHFGWLVLQYPDGDRPREQHANTKRL